MTANAGTGKTKVLTDRVLRLLLAGTVPEKILCLTYTRAAAAEMLTRLQKELSKWVRLPEEELTQTLTMLTGEAPSEALKRRARRLFLDVLEAPEGVRIMTIHSLCQSLLKRFSLEAGVSPYFRLMEGEQSRQLLQEARRLLFTESRLPQEIGELTPYLRKLAARLGDDDLNTLMNEIIAKRGTFEAWFREPDGTGQLRKAIEKVLTSPTEISPHPTLSQRERAISDHFQSLLLHLPTLTEASALLKLGGVGDKERAGRIDPLLVFWQQNPGEMPDESIRQEWILAFLTKKYEPRKSLMVAKQAKSHPHILEFLQAEQEKAMLLTQALFACEAAEWSEAAIHLAEALLALYAKLKRDRGFLDYDDLISDTQQLLSKEGIAPWVLFKLDHGIDHLLVDEAQDTSPIQWQIVRLLAEEFFSGQSARKVPRTLFVVGDEKQSIYRFQGADPQEFMRMKQYFSQKIQTAGELWKPVSLSLSFRSTPAVLKLVDTVFSQSEAADGVIEEGSYSQHQPDRKQEPGRVELWPLSVKPEQGEVRIPWQVPDARNSRENPTAESLCAHQIASKISEWLSNERFLAAKGRAVQAGDILILVRRRSPFYYRLMRALKKKNIPVAGEDRLYLLNELAVQDLLSLMNFLLLPEDDLSLAEVLKSPLFGISEEHLYQLAYGRTGSLWQAVLTQNLQLAGPLQEWLNLVDYSRPYELLSTILEAHGGRQKLVARLGTHIHDPLNELLQLAMQHEQTGPASLQRLVHELAREQVSIKREMEQSGDQVRVMTVHGSKGLQAPIVILPDTVSKPGASEKLLWTEDAVLFAPDNAALAEPVIQLKEQRKQQEMQEYRRLLYVAMTRAADELYVTGWLSGNQKEPAEDCWYAHIVKAMERVGEEREGDWLLEDGDGPLFLRRQESYQAEIPAFAGMTDLPSWLSQPMPQEPTPPRPLTPSRPALAEPSHRSPLDGLAAQRGTYIHRLLEILPDIPAMQREASSELLLKKLDIPALEKAEWIAQVMNILDDPRFASVFAEGSQAEVPVTALLPDHQIISGQIDRLVVRGDSVLIVDYKTSYQVPEHEAQLPDYFRTQMQAYVNALAPIYPNKKIEAAILWTHTPKLMPLAIVPSSP